MNTKLYQMKNKQAIVRYSDTVRLNKNRCKNVEPKFIPKCKTKKYFHQNYEHMYVI
ncbi:hypothetical protein HanIR_Chr13g0650461 [Helianthus annuus]|nr:hypothetical protein HanIR_Chr13g0650461 [Helianthus annuus]